MTKNLLKLEDQPQIRPLREILIDGTLGLLIISTTVFLGVKFGVGAAIAFIVLCIAATFVKPRNR